MIIVDTETTGLMNDPLAEVIEIGAVVMDAEHGELGAFSLLVMPGRLHPKAVEALRINRIDPDALTNAPTYDVARATFGAWKASWGGLMMTSWFIDFDKHFWPWLGGWASSQACIQSRAAAPMARAGLMVPREGRTRFEVPSLIEAASYFRTAVPMTPHRALDDARAAAAIWRAMERTREV
jgi:DNA polymerase III epsilon subunit-like protein